MRNRAALLAAVGLIGAAVAASLAQDPKSAPAPATDPTPPAGGRAAPGEYVEIDAEGRPNRDFLLLVHEVSPNIVHLRGRNGWVAFASYDADKKEYRGFFEWPDIPGRGRPGGKWAGLYQIRVEVRDGVLRVEGKSAANEMLIRAKPTGGPAPAVPEAKR